MKQKTAVLLRTSVVKCSRKSLSYLTLCCAQARLARTWGDQISFDWVTLLAEFLTRFQRPTRVGLMKRIHEFYADPSKVLAEKKAKFSFLRRHYWYLKTYLLQDWNFVVATFRSFAKPYRRSHLLLLRPRNWMLPCKCQLRMYGILDWNRQQPELGTASRNTVPAPRQAPRSTYRLTVVNGNSDIKKPTERKEEVVSTNPTQRTRGQL